MLKKTLCLGCLTTALLVSAPAAKAVDDTLDSPWFRLGAGVTVSPQLGDITDDYHFDTSGDWGWIDLNAGLEVPVCGPLSLIPYAAFYVNSMSGEDDSFNVMVVPALAAKLMISQCASMTDYWLPSADFDTYIQAEVNYPLPYASSDKLDMDRDGLGFAVLLGYQLACGLDLGIGYSYLPVKDDFDDDRNMGGLLVRLTKTL